MKRNLAGPAQVYLRWRAGTKAGNRSVFIPRRAPHDSRYQPPSPPLSPLLLLPISTTAQPPQPTAMSYRLPPISTLASAPHELQTILDHLFEPSPALYSLVAAHLPRSFTGYPEFCDWVGTLLPDAPPNQLLQILSAHPRLGAKQVDSAHSIEEQRSLAAASEEEGRRLEQLNREYEERFPGECFFFNLYDFFFGGKGGLMCVRVAICVPLPSPAPSTMVLMVCSVFVAGRSRKEVMKNMQERIERGDFEAEKVDAMGVCIPPLLLVPRCCC